MSFVDSHVGLRLQHARKDAGYTQKSLGAAVGVGMREIQKFESGENRISAGMMIDLARTLDRPISWFFDGLHKMDVSPRVD